MSILDHPDLKNLNPENEREGLLYLKAYFEAIQATLQAAQKFGLEGVAEFHKKVEAELLEKIQGDEQ